MYLPPELYGTAMPRYFFDVKNGHRLIDPSGLESTTTRTRLLKRPLPGRSRPTRRVAPEGT